MPVSAPESASVKPGGSAPAVTLSVGAGLPSVAMVELCAVLTGSRSVVAAWENVGAVGAVLTVRMKS